MSNEQTTKLIGEVIQFEKHCYNNHWSTHTGIRFMSVDANKHTDDNRQYINILSPYSEYHLLEVNCYVAKDGVSLYQTEIGYQHYSKLITLKEHSEYIKSLRKLERALEKKAQELGTPSTWEEFVSHICICLKVDTVYCKQKSERRGERLVPYVSISHIRDCIKRHTESVVNSLKQKQEETE